MNALTLDQFHVFVTVVDSGGFSAAARRLSRTQSAVTYAIQRLEDQVGSMLFDRSGYRPVPSPAGRALLPRARRILEEVGHFRAEAGGILSGVEPSVSLVVDAMTPMFGLTTALKDFQARFASVETRIVVESLGATAQMLIDDKADLGVIADLGVFLAETGDRKTRLERRLAFETELIAVASPDHPLALLSGETDAELDADTLSRHVQLVLMDRSRLTEGQDFGVIGVKTWRLGDLGAKHAMLLAGLGWGSMPAHMVADDLAAGRLVRLRPASWGVAHRPPKLAFFSTRRQDRPLGPAGQWLFNRLARATSGRGGEGPQRPEWMTD